MNCPLCNLPLIRRGSIIDGKPASFYWYKNSPWTPDVFCRTIPWFPPLGPNRTRSGDVRELNHYFETISSIGWSKEIRFDHYKISTLHLYATEKTVSSLFEYDGMLNTYKHVSNFPEIHPDTEANLRKRIKNLLLFI